MRPWKRVFTVLHHHSLFLYKDKREALLHGAGAGLSQDEQPLISIRGCLIDIAYSETKRKHTLRLTTQDFCEYLLQAEDRDDMLAWIRVIRENSKTDNEEIGFSRQALINKKLNDYRKHSLTGNKSDSSPRTHRMVRPFLLAKTDNMSVNRSPQSVSPTTWEIPHQNPPEPPPLPEHPRVAKGPLLCPDHVYHLCCFLTSAFLLSRENFNVSSRCLHLPEDDSKALWGINIMKKTKKTGSPKAFGVRLEDCQPAVNHKFVPLIVEMCCGVVEATGLEYTGIYRVPGNNAMVSNLQEHLNKGLELNTAEERWQDLNVISSLLKSFFRKLPEPLFTDDKYNDFIDANRIEDGEDRLKTMKKLIHNLPDHYYHTLQFLVGHLKRVADHSEKNKMEPRNLALVFGPTLVRTSEDNMTDMVTHMPDRYKIVETLILHYNWFFSNGELRQEEAAPEDKQDMQPVPNIDHLLTNIGRPGMPRETSDSTTSSSVNSKNSSGSRKDRSARDFLSRTIISAMTRKRKKCLSTHLAGSSADEDSDHEPVKATNYGGEESVEEGERGEEHPVVEEHTCSRTDGGPQKENVVDAEDGKGRTETGLRTKADLSADKPTSAWWLRPNTFLYSHHQTPTCQTPATNTLSHLKSRGCPSIPHWISPSRPPKQQQVSDRTQLPAMRPAASVHYRKTRVGRAKSMNVELELDWNQDRVKSARADGVEVIRIHEKELAEPGCGPTIGSGSETLSLPPASGCIHSGSQRYSSVVQRRPVRDPRDKTKAWRRHTVVV